MAEPFNDPNDTATAVVDRLLADDALLSAERKRIAEISFFLTTVKNWKATAEQGQGKTGFVLSPPPTPPAGYTFVDIDPVSTAPAQLPNGAIGPRDPFGNYPDYGNHSEQGDSAAEPAGKIVDNPYIRGAKLIKVVRPTPWGSAHYWVDKV